MEFTSDHLAAGNRKAEQQGDKGNDRWRSHQVSITSAAASLVLKRSVVACAAPSSSPPASFKPNCFEPNVTSSSKYQLVLFDTDSPDLKPLQMPKRTPNNVHCKTTATIGTIANAASPCGGK
jgi:hypothetical protein